MIVNTCRVFRTRFRKCSIMSSVRQLVTWRKEGHTAVVTLQAGDNRLTPDFLSSFNTVLDAVENDDTIRGLVTTNEGKIYSNGLALQLYANLSLEEMTEINKNVVMLLRRILTFPMLETFRRLSLRKELLKFMWSFHFRDNSEKFQLCISNIKSHAFAAGALLSLAHDYRVMRTGRGWFCLPEINIKLLFTMDFLQLAKAKLPPDQYVNCIVYGKRYTAEEAKRVGIIQECCESDKVLETAVELGNSIVSWQEEAFDRNLLAKMKEDLYHDTIKVFTNYPAKYYPKL